jgi:AraC-like DNA-binding protein
MIPYRTIDLEAPEWTGPYLRPCFFGFGATEANHPTDDLSRAALGGGAGWIYVLSGTMTVREANETFEVHAGQSLLFATPIRASLIFPGPLQRLSVAFHGNHSAQIFENLINRYGSVHQISRQAPPVRRARKLFAEATQHPVQSAHHWSMTIYDWMLDLWKEFEKRSTCLNPRRYLIRNSKLLGVLHPSFKSFSTAMGYHPAYLSRVIKKSWDNKSPARLLRLGRLREAEELLRTTNLSIREISQIVRYAKPESFATAFRRSYGMPPLKYRHEYRLGIPAAHEAPPLKKPEEAGRRKGTTKRPKKTRDREV